MVEGVPAPFGRAKGAPRDCRRARGARRFVARTRATACVSALPIGRRRPCAPRPPVWPIAPGSTRARDAAHESAGRSRPAHWSTSMARDDRLGEPSAHSTTAETPWHRRSYYRRMVRPDDPRTPLTWASVPRSGRPGSLLTLAPHRSGRAGSAASGSSTDGFATRRRVPAGPGSQAMATAIPKAYLASSAIRCRDVETGPNLGVLAVFPSTGATCRCPLPSTGSRGLNSPASAVL